jgi:hypothetical protein
VLSNLLQLFDELALEFHRCGALEPAALILGHLETKEIRSARLGASERNEILAAIAADSASSGAFERGQTMTHDQIVDHLQERAELLSTERAQDNLA